jgi:hypothetical protein
MMIFFEGVDMVGKTSLMKKFNLFTNYKYLTIDRGPLSYYVYSLIFERETHLTFQELCDILTRSIIVYVKSDVHTLTNRVLRFNHATYDILLHMKVFQSILELMKGCGVKVIEIINDDESSMDENVRRLSLALESETLP